MKPKVYDNSHYMKKLKDQLESYNTKQSLINFRKNLLERRKINNYSNEYENLRSILAHSVLPFQTKDMVEKRIAELKKLGAQAFEIS